MQIHVKKSLPFPCFLFIQFSVKILSFAIRYLYYSHDCSFKHGKFGKWWRDTLRRWNYNRNLLDTASFAIQYNEN